MNKSILVVDDDEDDHQIIRDTIAEAGIKEPVLSVLDGKMALGLLEQMRNNLPLLILLDINMPGMDGFETLTNIKEKFDIPVLICTTSCTDQVIKQSKGKGAVDCIQKPTNNREASVIGKKIAKILNALPGK